MEELLQIKKTEINIGLKRDYRFFQISDAHIAYIDKNSSQVDIEDNKRFHKQWDSLKVDFANQFNENCDERYDLEAHILFEKLASYAVEHGADVLVLSGDILDRVTDSNIRYLEKFISSYPLKVIYCPGNHAHHDEFGVRRNMYDRLQGVIKNPEFDVFDFDEFSVVTVDNGMKNITDFQIEKLKNEISKDKKILLVLHAPLNIGKFGEKMSKKISKYFLLGSEGDSENDFEFVNLIKSNDKKFIAILAGHIHGFAEYNVTDRLVQYTTSSALIGSGREIVIK